MYCQCLCQAQINVRSLSGRASGVKHVPDKHAGPSAAMTLLRNKGAAESTFFTYKYLLAVILIVNNVQLLKLSTNQVLNSHSPPPSRVNQCTMLSTYSYGVQWAVFSLIWDDIVDTQAFIKTTERIILSSEWVMSGITAPSVIMCPQLSSTCDKMHPSLILSFTFADGNGCFSLGGLVLCMSIHLRSYCTRLELLKLSWN